MFSKDGTDEEKEIDELKISDAIKSIRAVKELIKLFKECEVISGGERDKEIAEEIKKVKEIEQE